MAKSIVKVMHLPLLKTNMTSICFLSVQEPFPMGTNIRLRSGKPRTGGNEENYGQGSSSVSVNGEETLNGTDSSSKDSD